MPTPNILNDFSTKKVLSSVDVLIKKLSKNEKLEYKMTMEYNSFMKLYNTHR